MFLLSIHHLDYFPPFQQAPCYISHCLSVKHKNSSYTIPFRDLIIWGCKVYIINSKQGGNSLEPLTNTYPHAFTPDIEPYLFPPSEDGLFMGYSNDTKVFIYFVLKTRCIKRTFHCYIYYYDTKLHPKLSISLGDLMLQEYPSGVYQPDTPPPDPKICPIQPSLDITDSLFSST